MADSIDPGVHYTPLDDVPPPGFGRDNRPTYTPDALVAEVVELLARQGVHARVASPYVAGIAAADLLQALGVRPVTAAELPRRGR
jgi:hypothetical protein